jgi:hypothetical protein
MNRVYTLCFLFTAFSIHYSSSQEVIRHEFTISWSATSPLTFKGAGEYSNDTRLPLYTYRFPISSQSSIAAQLSVRSAESFTLPHLDPKPVIPRNPVIGATTENERGKWYARVWVMPIISSGGEKAERIISGEISIQLTPVGVIGTRSGPNFKETSVLSSGTIHKISVDRTGVYKIDYNFIKEKIKIDPSSITPDRFAIFSNGSGRMPQANNALRIDDLEEVPMMGVGMEDGRIDAGDYFLYYAEGPDKWTYETAERVYHMDKNIYDELNHYYIIINGPARTPMQLISNSNNGTYISNTSLAYQRLEEEKVNLLGRFRSPGSGQEWYGDEFAVVDQIDYTQKFDLSEMVSSDTVSYRVRFAARSGNASRFYVHFDEKEYSRSVGAVNLSSYESAFANDAIIQGNFVSSNPVSQIRVRYPEANGINNRAWIDYLEINFWKRNQYETGEPLFIRDPRSQFLGTPTYSVSGLPSGAMIWNITNPIQPAIQQFSSGQTSNFSGSPGASGFPSEFVAFNPATDVLTPSYTREIINQNLHSVNNADLLIIYYDDFESAALKLAEHRRAYSQLEVIAVPVSKVFEEFSGGSSDPTAIRDFSRMLYKRDPGFQYLLLVGDATYDYMNRSIELPDHNFIPAWETEESLDPIRSFPSDDYFALLDDDEGQNLIGAIDIAVGRLPVESPEDANAIVDKIIYYDTNPLTLNDWRQRVVMVADDQDNNLHLEQADGMAEKIMQDHRDLNIIKIYLDAYPQESTPGGDRYPAVNDDIDLNMKKGALTFTYMGHGGQNGWTQERVLGINQAKSYDNINNMPLFITATCSFAGYDEPSFKTAGEHLLTNPLGGAIALMTTVRAVYSGSNKRLTENVLELIYNPEQPGVYPSISEVLRRAKNTGQDSLDINARKFTLLGDPSLKLAFPRYHVGVTTINGKSANASEPDTLSALEKSIITGTILNDNGEVMTSFNGKIFLTVFDKVQIRKTLANDEDSQERNFNTQSRQLFKGTASVQNGTWSIEFVLPKDLDFAYGSGKMSFYAHNDIIDAAGHFTSFLIGGVSNEGLADDQPPVIELFMNDENFVTGGITDKDPDIYIQLMDDFGINVSGTGVGHDIEAVLDNDDKNSFILNEFYQASLDDYRSGEVRYPLSDLATGKHTLKVTAWDLANNPAEAYIEFLVLDDEGAVLKHVLNYPNPFTTSTYFQFEHNRPGVEMNLQVQIYTINGRLVKTIEREAFISEGYRIDDLYWDGLDDSGDQLGKGIYVYRIRVAYNINGRKDVVESKAEKLVILR